MADCTIGIAAIWALADASPTGGGYVSLPGIIGMLVVVTLWLYALPWVNRDSKEVRAASWLWNSVTLGAGAMGLLLWMLLPMYAVGMSIFVVLALSSLIAYVVYRNGRVEPDLRVLTANHISSLFKGEGGRRKHLLKPVTRLKVYQADRRLMAPPSTEATAEEIEAYNQMQELLYDLAWRRASEADITPVGQTARVRFVVDGVAVERPQIQTAEAEAIIQLLKAAAGVTVDERRRPQKGSISVDLAQGATEVTLVSAGTTAGQRMQFRIVRESVQTKIDELGLNPDYLAKVMAYIGKPNGLVIVAGARGSGMTSTMYSMMRQHDAFIKQLVMLEAKPSATLDNITQHEYKDDAALSGALASAIRRDPDIIMVDQCPDEKTASLIMDAAREKWLVTGIRGSDAFSALGKWAKMCGDVAGAVQNLHGIVCQMLMRKLCPTCREPYMPDPALLAKANLKAKQIEKFFRPPTQQVVDDKGRPIICQTCQGSGYFGRTAVFELLEMTDEIRALVASGAPIAQIKAACRKNKMLYLQEQAIQCVIDGVTSIQEVIRVSQQKQPAKPSQEPTA